MKKSLFKLVLGIFATVMLFSSCLGDGGRSDEFTVFGYITTTNGTQYAATAAGNYISNEIGTLTPGKCYILSLRTSSDIYSGNIMTAQDIAKPVALTTTYGRVEPPTVEGIFNPSAFQPEIFASNDYFGDNWCFIYKAKLKEKDTPRAYCFYDVNRQYEMIDGVPKNLDKNQIIIDVRFDNTPGADGSTLDTYWRSVCNLSGIKSSYKEDPERYDPTKTTDNYVLVAVKFRYNQLQSDGSVKEDVCVGSWTSNPYYFAYERDK